MRPPRIIGAAALTLAAVSVVVLAFPTWAAADAQPPSGGPSKAASTADAQPPSGAPSNAAPTADEQARDLFRAQRYAEAVRIYERLRAETRHPTYLRNIGRCHQMMRQPKPAIVAFEAYLREAPSLGVGERTEIQGYLAEMRQLEAKAPPSTAGVPALVVNTPGTAGPGSPTIAVSTATAPPETGTSIVRRWWFWAGVGALIVATGVIAVAASGGDDRLPCPGGAVCP